MHADALLTVWTTARLEPLRTCAASALCRLLRCHPSLLSAIASRPDLMQQVRIAGSLNFPVSHPSSGNKRHTHHDMLAEVGHTVLLRLLRICRRPHSRQLEFQL